MQPAASLTFLIALAGALAASPAAAETIGGNPGPEHNYVCPHADGKPALDCFFDAVQHLYTMCRNVKSIEILEFGYENSRDGVNAAKYEYCLDKQKQNIAKPYKAALRDAGKAKPLVDDLKGLHELWLSALAQLQWQQGESDADYKQRVAHPYEVFSEKISLIRTRIATLEAEAAAAKAAKAAKKTTKTAKTANGKPSEKAKKH